MKANQRLVPRELCGWNAADEGPVVLDLGDATAELSLAEDGSLRLRAAPGSALAPDPAPAIGRAPWSAALGRPLEREGGGLRLAHEGPHGAALVEVEARPLSVRVRDRAGAIVAELSALSFGADGSARIALSAGPGERFFGFGEKTGSLDKRGQRLRMRNRDPQLRMRDPLYLSIPFFLGLDPKGAGARGVFLEAFGPSRFDVGAASADTVELETDSGGIDLTIFPGPTPRDVLRRFTARVGRGPLPPLWALGHHQSRWSYASEGEVRSIAAEIRARRIPTDAIHLDIDYMDGFRVFTFDAKRFPDPGGLIAELEGRGLRVVTIVDPGVKIDPGYAVYRSGVEKGVFCTRDDGTPYHLSVWPGPSALPDFNREAVRRWWGEQHRPLLEAGVAGIWNDMNEPAGWARGLRLGRLVVPTAKQDVSRLMQSDPAAPDRSVPHESVRNLYGYQECRATQAGLETQRPGKRPFVLSRSGYAGIQRHAAVWTGDNRSRWSDLRDSIPMLLNLSLSGVAFCGADIGGFALSCTPELYARWIQLGALQPFARTHAMWAKRRQEPWRFGRRVESIAREALELRMRLLPYLYGLFHETEREGSPIWRPLFFEFPDDPEAATVEDQLMLGPSLLVAPVVERGARERDVYLPAGSWVGWHDDVLYRGPQRVRVAAPLERLPLFARAGSVIPTQSAIAHVEEEPAEPCVLEVFPGGDANVQLLEDDGETLEYRNGGLARTEIRLWDRAGGRLRLEVGRREGGYAIPRRPVRASVHACPPPTAVYLDGSRLAAQPDPPGYTTRGVRVDVRFEDDGGGHTLEIDPAP